MVRSPLIQLVGNFWPKVDHHKVTRTVLGLISHNAVILDLSLRRSFWELFHRGRWTILTTIFFFSLLDSLLNGLISASKDPSLLFIVKNDEFGS